MGNDYLVGFCWFVRRRSRRLHQSVVVLLLSLSLSPIPSPCSVQLEIWAKFLTKKWLREQFTGMEDTLVFRISSFSVLKSVKLETATEDTSTVTEHL